MCEKDNFTFLRLFCSKCDNLNCNLLNDFRYIEDNSQKGCSRWVNELVLDKYYHYFQEVIPLWKFIDNDNLINEQYKEIISFLYQKIYNKKITCLYDSKGKTIGDKNLIKNLNKEFNYD